MGRVIGFVFLPLLMLYLIPELCEALLTRAASKQIQPQGAPTNVSSTASAGVEHPP